MSNKSDASYAVDRCYCCDVTFENLLKQAQEENLDFEGLRQSTGCATVCGLCEPYVRVALRTGSAKLPVLTQDEIDRTLREKSE